MAYIPIGRRVHASLRRDLPMGGTDGMRTGSASVGGSLDREPNRPITQLSRVYVPLTGDLFRV